jgi:hypothetical protein
MMDQSSLNRIDEAVTIKALKRYCSIENNLPDAKHSESDRSFKIVNTSFVKTTIAELICAQ